MVRERAEEECRTMGEAYDEGYKQGREDAFEEYYKEMRDMIEGNEEFTEWQKHEVLACNDLVFEQLKGQQNE